MELSIRLNAVKSLVTPGMRVADIGTDHAYVPIALLEEQISPSAVAMDVNQGPLERAKENIRKHHLEDRITTRLSNGLAKLEAGEADCMIAAGMGGALIIRILEDGRFLADSLREYILQPQSEIDKVRRYLQERGFSIVEERFVKDDGKYYAMMKVHPKQESQEESYTEVEYRFGKRLLQEQNPVLKEYLEREKCTYHNILMNLENKPGEKNESRIRELKEEIRLIEEALARFEM